MSERYDQRYQAIRVQTASRKELLLILYQGTLGAMRRASRAYSQGANLKAQGEVLRAQGGIVQLISSLDMKAGGEFSEKLSSLYLYVNQLLINTLRDSDTRPLAEATRLIHSLYEAWQQAFAKAA